jgi:hypothetical protein
MGFVCGVLVSVLWRLSKRRGTGVLLGTTFAVRTSPLPPRLRPMQFGMSGLLIAVALCAGALGIGRWLWYFVYDRPHLVVLVQATEARVRWATLSGREILVADMNAYWNAKPGVGNRGVSPVSRTQARFFALLGYRARQCRSQRKGVITVSPCFRRRTFRISGFCDIPDVEFVPHPYTVPDGCYYVLETTGQGKDSRCGAGCEAKIVGRYPYVGGGAERE